MFSGKTSALISRFRRYEIGGFRCIMVKYKMDDRYDSYSVVTHDKVSEKAVSCRYLHEADSKVVNYDVICVDEVQFYKDADILCDKWANQGKIVVACGLNGTYTREPWPVMSRLFALADDISFVTAVCRNNGKDAVYSHLKQNNNSGEMEIIGGDDKYDAVNRSIFFEDVSSIQLHRGYIGRLLRLLNPDKEEKIKKFLEKHNNEIFELGYDTLVDLFHTSE